MVKAKALGIGTVVLVCAGIVVFGYIAGLASRTSKQAWTRGALFVGPVNRPDTVLYFPKNPVWLDGYD